MALECRMNKFSQKAFASSAMKTVNFLASAINNHRRKTANLVPTGNSHVLVGVDLSQEKLAPIILSQLF